MVGPVDSRPLLHRQEGAAPGRCRTGAKSLPGALAPPPVDPISAVRHGQVRSLPASACPLARPADRAVATTV